MTLEEFLDQLVVCAFWTVVVALALYFVVTAARNWIRQKEKDEL